MRMLFWMFRDRIGNFYLCCSELRRRWPDVNYCNLMTFLVLFHLGVAHSQTVVGDWPVFDLDH